MKISASWENNGADEAVAGGADDDEAPPMASPATITAKMAQARATVRVFCNSLLSRVPSTLSAVMPTTPSTA